MKVKLRANIAQRLCAVVASTLSLDRHPSEAAVFEADLGADSLDCIALAMAFETEFLIEESNESVFVTVITVGDAIDAVMDRLHPSEQ